MDLRCLNAKLVGSGGHTESPSELESLHFVFGRIGSVRLLVSLFSYCHNAPLLDLLSNNKVSVVTREDQSAGYLMRESSADVFGVGQAELSS